MSIINFRGFIIKVYVCLLLCLLNYNFNLNSAIGCQSFEHTIDSWNISKPIYQECDCPCRQVDFSNRGQCYLCGHYGNPERGAISARVLAGVNIILP